MARPQSLKGDHWPTSLQSLPPRYQHPALTRFCFSCLHMSPLCSQASLIFHALITSLSSSEVPPEHLGLKLKMSLITHPSFTGELQSPMAFSFSPPIATAHFSWTITSQCHQWISLANHGCVSVISFVLFRSLLSLPRLEKPGKEKDATVDGTWLVDLVLWRHCNNSPLAGNPLLSVRTVGDVLWPPGKKKTDLNFLILDKKCKKRS